MMRILVGYLAACFAVGIALWAPLTVASIASVVINGPPHADYSLANTFAVLVVYTALTALATLMLTAPAAAILIIIAERLKVRAWWGYAIGAALMGAAAYGGLPWALPGAQAELGGAALFAALGAIAGLVYWFIAVRGRKQLPSRG